MMMIINSFEDFPEIYIVIQNNVLEILIMLIHTVTYIQIHTVHGIYIYFTANMDNQLV